MYLPYIRNDGRPVCICAAGCTVAAENEEVAMQLKRDNGRGRGRGSLMDLLFDNGNTGELTLENEKGQKLAVKQVYAAIKNDAVYCILAPAEEVADMPEDGAFVFALSSEGELKVVTDALLCGQIFAEYYRSIKTGGK